MDNPEHKILKRGQGNVIRLHIELTSALFDRLEEYSKKYGKSKRDVVSEALLIWLNKRESGEW
jgi:metal-responsive CopG/Arc/MetJ family transcriptional regulator